MVSQIKYAWTACRGTQQTPIMPQSLTKPYHAAVCGGHMPCLQVLVRALVVLGHMHWLRQVLLWQVGLLKQDVPHP